MRYYRHYNPYLGEGFPCKFDEPYLPDDDESEEDEDAALEAYIEAERRAYRKAFGVYADDDDRVPFFTGYQDNLV